MLDMISNNLGDCLQVIVGEGRINKFVPGMSADIVRQTFKNLLCIALLKPFLSLEVWNFHVKVDSLFLSNQDFVARPVKEACSKQNGMEEQTHGNKGQIQNNSLGFVAPAS